MAILKRYKILFLALIGIALFFYIYNIWIVNKTIDDMITKLLKRVEYNEYNWDIKR